MGGIPIPSLSFGSNPSSGATGGTITMAPIYVGDPASAAASALGVNTTALLPYLALALVVYLLVKGHV